jgi:multidrug resistance efflux pump
MIAIVGVATCSLLLAATDAQDTRDAKPTPAQQGWLTFDQCLVLAPESYEISAKETGVIAELNIRENDLVKIDQPLGQLDSESAKLERQAAGIQSKMATFDANDDSDVRLAESFVEEATLQLNAFEEMVNKGGAAIVEVRQKKLAVEQSKARLTKSKADKAKRDLLATQAAIAYQMADLKTERLKLTSPATGTVAKVERRSGEWVAAGTTIAKVVRLDELRVDFYVDTKQVDLTSLQQQPVTISADLGVTGSKDFAGKITGYASEVGSTGKVRVNAMVQNQKINDRWLLLPGMPVVLKLVPKSQ